MTHDDAIARAAELNREEHDARRWFARPTGSGEYEVVAVTAPGLPAHGDLKATVVSKPEPSDAPDPRPSLYRNIPPFGAG
ncbi:MAG TPA: hypothetical protein VIY10_04770 [Solirubrobacteraceae bacterium]